MREADEAWKRAQLLGGQPTASASFPHCTPYKLPSLGVIQLSPDHIITLESDAIFTPSCAFADQGIRPEEEGGGITTIADFRDPFHASITPQAYATGAATVIAWMLVIMLIITPRTFFVGGSSGRSGLMGRRGMISGASGGGSIIGVGTRPWLQKVAALTVAVSLTLATADTFKIAERQYESGIMDATELRDQVVSGLEIRVSRVVSDVFLWLAQVQTLIRLFPRHKEKVIIKWVGFALILLDIIFSSLNSFGPYDTNRRPPHFATAIPALSYLFQLSLSMLYAAWVMYYAITKRRYAFYHSMMWNIAIVALLSVIAILTPVVFFITDIANYSIAGWGDYFRWVGAAAASVIVWEWVERIEALEREERKDGILGREIYDGDDMLDTTPSHEVTWPQSKRQSYMNDNDSKPGNGGSGGANAFASGHMARFTNLAQRLGRTMTESPRAEARKKRTIHIPAPPPAHRRSDSSHRPGVDGRTYHPLQNPPTVPVVSSPVSRTDTTSADSTVYTVRYHPISETPPIQQPVALGERLEGEHAQNNTQTQEPQSQVVLEGDLEKGGIEVVDSTGTSRSHNRSKWHWQAVTQPFRRKGQAPPEEVQKGRVVEPLVMDDVTANIPPRNYSGLALKDRLGTFAAHQGERFRSKKNTTQQSESSLPVTIIPAQPRGKTWSPEILHQQQPQSEEVSDEVGISVAREPPRSVPVIPEDENEQIEAANRNSRIRFAPETFHRHSGRQGVEEETRGPSRPLSSAVLGTEVHEQVPWTGSTQMVQDQPSGVDPSIVEQPTHTNHDR